MTRFTPDGAKLESCSACGKNQTRLYKVRRLGLKDICLKCGRDAVAANPPSAHEVRLARRRRLRREREDVLRDLGLTKCRVDGRTIWE